MGVVASNAWARYSSAQTNSTRQLKAVAQVVEFRNSAGQDVWLLQDDLGHNLEVVGKWQGEAALKWSLERNGKPRRYRCARCKKEN
jgi:hypothetical protein